MPPRAARRRHKIHKPVMPADAGTITRFAPSPTGPLHLGHAFAARFAWERARAGAGRFLIRIEDIDAGRCRPEYAEAALADLAWLGFPSEGEILVQSARLPHYAAALARLREAGLLYPCFCSRADVQREIAGAAAAPHGPDGSPRYPGTCRALAAGERQARLDAGLPHSWRLDMAAALRRVPPLTYREAGERHLADPSGFGDVVLGRRDAPASYHLCATLDDAAQGVTLVTRGEDLRPAASLHRLLQALLGWPEPEYAHHPLICGLDGARLSKRNGAVAIAALREAGFTPGQVLARAG